MIENQCQTSGSRCRRQVAADNRRHLTCPQYVPSALRLGQRRFDSVCWENPFIGDRSIFLGRLKTLMIREGQVEWSSMVGVNPPSKFQGRGLNGTSVARLKAGTGLMRLA